MIIAIEGVDGIGKETQASLLAKHLGASLHSYPNYDRWTGKIIKRLLNGTRYSAQDAHPWLMAYLYALDRRWEYLKWQPSKHRVLDRYTASNMVYQGLRGLDHWDIYKIEGKMGIPEPDFYIHLDINNLNARTCVGKDAYEGDVSFQYQLRDRYRVVMRHLDAHLVNCDSAGILRPIEEIHRDILDVVNTREKK